jgi:hypothetical protein
MPTHHHFTSQIIVRVAVTLFVTATQKLWGVIFKQGTVIQRLNGAIVPFKNSCQLAQLG